LGTSLAACTVRGKTAAPRRRARPPNPTSSEADELANQLTAALLVDDPPVLPVQMELLTDLADLAGNRATAGLIEVASVSTVASELRAEARTRLVRRRSGAAAMLEALRNGSPSWPFGARPIPLAELAHALAAMDERRAATLLGAHLLRTDPKTAEAVAVARALTKLATDKERWALRLFAMQHHCETSDSRSARAVLAVLKALVGMGHMRMAKRIATASCAGAELRRRLEPLLDRGTP